VNVSIVYALPHRQFIETLDVPEGTTVEQLIHMSGFLEQHPEIDLTKNKVGIFAKLVKLSQELQEGDRVEIYRPLPRKPRDAHAVDDKKARIRARKDARKKDTPATEDKGGE